MARKRKKTEPDDRSDQVVSESSSGDDVSSEGSEQSSGDDDSFGDQQETGSADAAVAVEPAPRYQAIRIFQIRGKQYNRGDYVDVSRLTAAKISQFLEQRYIVPAE